MLFLPLQQWYLFLGVVNLPRNVDITNGLWDQMDERWKRFEIKPGT